MCTGNSCEIFSTRVFKCFNQCSGSARIDMFPGFPDPLAQVRTRIRLRILPFFIKVLSGLIQCLRNKNDKTLTVKNLIIIIKHFTILKLYVLDPEHQLQKVVRRPIGRRGTIVFPQCEISNAHCKTGQCAQVIGLLHSKYSYIYTVGRGKLIYRKRNSNMASNRY